MQAWRGSGHQQGAPGPEQPTALLPGPGPAAGAAAPAASTRCAPPGRRTQILRTGRHPFSSAAGGGPWDASLAHPPAD